MDLANVKCQITNLALGPIMNSVLEVKNQFDLISFTRIYKVYNSKANTLSTDALILQEGYLTVHEYKEDVLSSKSSISNIWLNLEE